MLEILKESHYKIEKLREKDAYINELYTTYETTKTVADRNILVDELANRFCKAYDESNFAEMDTYFSTLLVQCWKQMTNFYNGVKVEGNIEYSDLPSIFNDRLLYACKYRAWQNPEKKLHAHQCINMCIATEKANVFGRSNWQCNKSNASAHRFNQEMFKLDDDEDDFFDRLPDENSAARSNFGFTVKDIVNDYINSNQLDFAIILDAICYSVDCFQLDKKTHESRFMDSRIKKYLKNLNDYDVKEFCRKYHTSVEIIDKAMKRIAKYKSAELSLAIQNATNSFEEVLKSLVR